MIPSPTNPTKTYNTTDYSMVVSPTRSSQACQCPERNITDKLTLSGACLGGEGFHTFCWWCCRAKLTSISCCWTGSCPSGMSNAMPGCAFSHPLKHERKKYLYCSQVWQCSQNHFNRKQPPKNHGGSMNFPTHAAHTSGLYHKSGGFSWALSHTSCTKATEQLCASLVSSCEPAISETKSCQTDGEVWWNCLPCPGQPGQADGISVPQGPTAGGSVSMWY